MMVKAKVNELVKLKLKLKLHISMNINIKTNINMMLTMSIVCLLFPTSIHGGPTY